MNENVIDDLRFPGKPAVAKRRVPSSVKWGLVGYGLLLMAIVVGWLMRESLPITPKTGVGYWLGIVGGTLMLLLVFYPAGKKSRLFQRLGWTKHWFRIHILFGLIGPLLILYHANFRVHAINSRVAFYSMLAVAVSGVVGRYIYARIHRGLSGKRTHVEELRAEIADAVENSRGIAAILPQFINEMHGLSAELLGDKYTRVVSVRRSLLWTWKHHYVRAKLHFAINRELKARAEESEPIRDNFAELRTSALHYMNRQVKLLRRVAQLSFYERLFSLWHLFHMPLFILLVISASVHVLAVHMF
jgi:hypothetical protein